MGPTLLRYFSPRHIFIWGGSHSRPNRADSGSTNAMQGVLRTNCVLADPSCVHRKVRLPKIVTSCRGDAAVATAEAAIGPLTKTRLRRKRLRGPCVASTWNHNRALKVVSASLGRNINDHIHLIFPLDSLELRPRITDTTLKPYEAIPPPYESITETHTHTHAAPGHTCRSFR